MQVSQEELQAVIKVLKVRFNNLSATQLIEIAFEILQAIAEAKNDSI